MKNIICTPKRMVFARFDEGEDLLLSLKSCATEHGIKSGCFNAIGALKEISYGLYKDGQHKSIHKTAKHCFEILSISGNITQKNKEVFIHAHITASDEKGMAFGGHLVEGSIIYPFAEVVIWEIDKTIDRTHDPKTNLWPIKF